MLSLHPAVRVFVAVEPFDMRGSFDAIAGAVRRIGLDPVNGHLYLFFNKRRRLAKALWFDGSAFASLLAGIDFTAARRGWYRRPRPEKVEQTIDIDPQM